MNENTSEQCSHTTMILVSNSCLCFKQHLIFGTKRRQQNFEAYTGPMWMLDYYTEKEDTGCRISGPINLAQ